MQPSASIVGVWEVHAPDAPFPWHMMTFTPYGTVLQSNPHEGNRAESDSAGHGVWQTVADHDDRGDPSVGDQSRIAAQFVEFKADRRSGRPLGKGVVRLTCVVDGDHFEGTADAYVYDPDGTLISGPQSTTLAGRRVRLGRLP